MSAWRTVKGTDATSDAIVRASRDWLSYAKRHRFLRHEKRPDTHTSEDDANDDDHLNKWILHARRSISFCLSAKDQLTAAQAADLFKAIELCVQIAYTHIRPVLSEAVAIVSTGEDKQDVKRRDIRMGQLQEAAKLAMFASLECKVPSETVQTRMMKKSLQQTAWFAALLHDLTRLCLDEAAVQKLPIQKDEEVQRRLTIAHEMVEWFRMLSSRVTLEHSRSTCQTHEVAYAKLDEPLLETAQRIADSIQLVIAAQLFLIQKDTGHSGYCLSTAQMAITGQRKSHAFPHVVAQWKECAGSLPESSHGVPPVVTLLLSDIRKKEIPAAWLSPQLGFQPSEFIVLSLKTRKRVRSRKIESDR